MSWKIETFGSLLQESRIPAENPDANKRIRVKLNVLGVEKRPVGVEKEGATNQYIRKAGQFIYGKQNFHKGAFGIVPESLDGFETSADIPSFDVREDCLPEWIFYFFKVGNKFLELEKFARGVGSKRIHPKQIEELEIPLPPIRIQEKVIGKVKKLESSGQELSTELTHQLDLVKQLRQAFLREAIQGKLVPQDPNDEPASVLLKKIKAEKEQLIKEKKIKKGKPLPPVSEEEVPFDIPDNWVWCRLGEVVELISGQDLNPSQYSDQKTDGLPYLTGASNFNNGNVILNRWTKSPRSVAYKGDLLVTCKGSGIGKMATLEAKKVHIARQIMAIRNFASLPSYFIQKIVEFNVTDYKSKSKSSIPGIGRDIVLNTLSPLPPLAEQLRIVAKLEELMNYCDQLEERIKASQQYNEQLLQQVLREALEPERELVGEI
ncbi:restriction endonuclease subunit S [Cytophagaceae bacterium ABcell3]|nr:restriction endonuclease subunit S [Cytophagaceae bacterium ABcell3]